MVKKFFSSKTKNNVKNIFLLQYKWESGKIIGLLWYKTDCKNIFYCDVPDKMAANTKLSPQYYGVTIKSNDLPPLFVNFHIIT
jgi:hypothetical protein